MKIQKLDRVSVAGRSLQEARNFYGDLFDTHFDEVEIDILPSPHVRVGVSPLGIELVEQGPSIKQESIKTIVLKTDSVRATEEEMIARGFSPVGRVDAGTLKEAIYEIRGLRLAFAEYDESKSGIHPVVNSLKTSVPKRS